MAISFSDLWSENVLAKANLLFNGMYNNPSPKIGDCEPERFSVQARNNNEEDRELEGVPNVMRLYQELKNLFLYVKIEMVDDFCLK